MNHEALIQLIAASKEDAELLDMIWSAVQAFEQYHTAVLEDQAFPLIYSGALEGDTYRTRRAELDKHRTTLHNAVITHVRILNRMAEQTGLPPIYAGIVSEDRPYRRQIADTVFAYLSSVIDGRS